MTTRTYTRTYRAEVTETRTISDADLTDMDRRILDAWEADEDFNGGPVLTSDVDEILEIWNADHKTVTAIDDWQMTIERTP